MYRAYNKRRWVSGGGWWESPFVSWHNEGGRSGRRSGWRAAHCMVGIFGDLQKRSHAQAAGCRRQAAKRRLGGGSCWCAAAAQRVDKTKPNFRKSFFFVWFHGPWSPLWRYHGGGRREYLDLGKWMRGKERWLADVA